MANDNGYFCSTLSLEASEPLYGSAPEKQVWFLLEYNRPWGAQAFPESDLSEAVKTRISGWLNSVPNSNILLIRRPGQQNATLTFQVVFATESSPHAYAFELADYDDLLTIDMPALVKGDVVYADHYSTDPLYLVCTNAKRDQCCAKYGVGIYNELRRYAGERVWQCSHLGGHRFAPTSLFMPQGICYGRIQPDHVGTMVEAHVQGRIFLDHLRGRVCYDGPAQAADYLLRAQNGITAMDAVKHIETQAAGTNAWIVQFEVNGETHSIRLNKVKTDAEIFTSCFNDKREVVSDYVLV